MPTYPSSVTSGSPVWIPIRTRTGLKERVLRVGSGGDCLLCPRKRVEERIALRVHLDPAVTTEGVAQDPPMPASTAA